MAGWIRHQEHSLNPSGHLAGRWLQVEAVPLPGETWEAGSTVHNAVLFLMSATSVSSSSAQHRHCMHNCSKQTLQKLLWMIMHIQMHKPLNPRPEFANTIIARTIWMYKILKMCIGVRGQCIYWTLPSLGIPMSNLYHCVLWSIVLSFSPHSLTLQKQPLSWHLPFPTLSSLLGTVGKIYRHTFQLIVLTGDGNLFSYPRFT